MEKKEYITPKMEVVEMKSQAVLLDGSAQGPSTTLYSDEFGYNYNPDMDNKA